MATRLDHLEMVLERRWYDCSNCRRLPSSYRSALVGGCAHFSRQSVEVFYAFIYFVNNARRYTGDGARLYTGLIATW